MFLAERLELDVENQGNRLIAWIGTLLNLLTRYVPKTIRHRSLCSRDSANQNGCGQQSMALGRQNSELANGPPKNRTGSRRLAAGCRRGPGNVSTKFKLATQRATKRSSFGSLRLRHICEPSRFGDAHDRGPCVRVFPHELLKIRPAQHQKLAICNRNHVSLPDSTR
jgi:hypothetical protein